jgi:hypothetical protein
MSWLYNKITSQKPENIEYIFLGTKLVPLDENGQINVFLYLKETESDKVVIVKGFPRKTVILPTMNRYPKKWIDSTIFYEDEQLREKDLQEKLTNFITVEFKYSKQKNRYSAAINTMGIFSRGERH